MRAIALAPVSTVPCAITVTWSAISRQLNCETGGRKRGKRENGHTRRADAPIFQVQQNTSPRRNYGKHTQQSWKRDSTMGTGGQPAVPDLGQLMRKGKE
jgi:hypothetical protein